MVSKENLINFTKEIASIYEQGKIKAPVHLSGGNEDELIKIFEDFYKEGDWICSTWRSHYAWLLSGRSPEALKEQILAGYSMSVFDDRFITSSIVGGITPIALGIAYGIKERKESNKVLCFLGDMAASGGLAHECIRYAIGWDLPIIYIIEDNNRSVRASTRGVWGEENGKQKLIKYSYQPTFPHAGTGKYVMF